MFSLNLAISTDGIAGSYGNPRFTFWGTTNCFPNDGTTLHSHQPCIRVPISPHFWQQFYCLYVLFWPCWPVWSCILSFWFAVLWQIMLIIFSCAYLTTCISSLEKCFFQSFSFIKLGYMSFYCRFLKVLYTFLIQICYIIFKYFLPNIFSQMFFFTFMSLKLSNVYNWKFYHWE